MSGWLNVLNDTCAQKEFAENFKAIEKCKSEVSNNKCDLENNY